MKKHHFTALFMAAALLIIAVPHFASAHEREVFKIGDKTYMFVIGSLNEPVFVDDKTGVDLRIQLADPNDPTNSSSPNLKPVEKLETSLKVEISAGDKKQLFDLEPAFRDPGAYRAPFFPTVPTTYTYRVFGNINNVPVVLAFTCNPAGHPQMPEDKSQMKISDGVTRIFKAGAFGCPKSKGNVEFPEKTASNYEQMENAASANLTYAAGLIALIALGIAIAALRKK